MLAGLALVAAATVLGMASLSSCGGGGDQRASPTPPSGQSAPTSVPQENTRPGTRAWRLSPHALERRRGLVEGYVSAPVLEPGQTQRVYVNAPGAASVRVSVFRSGFYAGKGGRLVLQSGRLRAQTQPPCAHSDQTGVSECRWRSTFSFRAPPSLPSGVYLARLATDRGAERYTLFVVRSPRPAPLLVVLPTTTYEAYNDWGGDSLYPARKRVGVTGTTQGVEVSFDRPYAAKSGAGEYFDRDAFLVRFLEEQHLPVSYTTDQSLDEHPEQLAGARAIVVSGHSEYWSRRASDALTRARDRGQSLAFLSSDTMAWRVRYAPATSASSEPKAPGHRVIAYKEHVARDPDRAAPTGAGRGAMAGLTGLSYADCITPRVRPGVYRYFPWSPDTRSAPSWLSGGTGFTARSQVPGIVGYELDERVHTVPGARVVGGGPAACMGDGTRRVSSVLASGRAGATIFASGTLGWELALAPLDTPVAGHRPPGPASGSPIAALLTGSDHVPLPTPRPSEPLRRMTRNLLDHMLAGGERFPR